MKPRDHWTHLDDKILQLQFKVCTQSLSAVTAYMLAPTDRAIRQHQSINTNFIVNVVFLITILYSVDDNIYSCRHRSSHYSEHKPKALDKAQTCASGAHTYIATIQLVQLQLHFIASTIQLSTKTNCFHEKSCEVDAGRFQHTIHIERHTFRIKHIRHWSTSTRTT